MNVLEIGYMKKYVDEAIANGGTPDPARKPQLEANKVDAIDSSNKNDSDKYPSVKAVTDYLNGANGPAYASDALFRYVMFGEAVQKTVSWDFTKGSKSTLAADDASVPQFTVNGSPIYSALGIYARWSRAKDWADLSLEWLQGLNWTISVRTSDYGCTSQTLQQYDVPVTLITKGADTPSFIAYVSTDTGDNGFVMHRYGLNAFAGFGGETNMSVADRKFVFARNAKDNTLTVSVYTVSADGTETLGDTRIVNDAGDPDTLRLCSDVAGYKGCMIPIRSLEITYDVIPEE